MGKITDNIVLPVLRTWAVVALLTALFWIIIIIIQNVRP